MGLGELVQHYVVSALFIAQMVLCGTKRKDLSDLSVILCRKKVATAAINCVCFELKIL